jgi:DNA-binding NtrC family response regulator
MCVKRKIWREIMPDNTTLQNILIADNGNNMQSLSKALKENYHITSAYNGCSANDVLQKGNIQVAVLSDTLPGPKVRRVAEEALKKNPGIHIIVCSEDLDKYSGLAEQGVYVHNKYEIPTLIEYIKNLPSLPDVK